MAMIINRWGKMIIRTAIQYRMKTLLFAAILYLTGIVVVLLLRPALMFDEQGQWKEFGTISNDHTIFPFWLFCIMWGAVSYCITLFFVNEPFGAAVATVAAARKIREELPEGLVEPLPPKKKSKPAKPATHGDMKPGYYILDAKELKRTGVPKYTYVGDENSQLVPATVTELTESEAEE